MTKEKGLSGCDAQPPKVVPKLDGVSHSATAFQSQTRFLRRRFGVAPLRAEIIAAFVFGEERRP